MKPMIIASITLMILIAAPLSIIDVGADSGFDITDGEGRTFHYDAPAEHVVSAGFATTLTIADAGAIDKIVAVDKYSTFSYTKNDKLSTLDAVDLGSFYGTTNHDYIKTTLVKMVEDKKMSLDDTIILTSYTANRALYDDLTSYGFTHVLLWITISDFDGIINFVESVTKIVTGSDSDSVKKMRSNIDSVKNGLSGIKDEDRANALFVWYTSGKLDVGNTTIMNSMLEVCKANNLGYSATEGAHYGDTNMIVKILGDNPNTVVFINNSYKKTVEDFRNDVLNGNTDIPVVIMEQDWNNSCPESADGLLTMAKYLYPQIMGEPYDGYMDEYGMEHPDSDKDNNTILITAVVAVLAVIAVVGVVMLRKRP